MSREAEKHRGTLYIRIGPMFSGKTSWLNSELTQLADTNFSVVKITHSSDVRTDVEACDGSGSTHNSSYKTLTPKIDTIRSSSLKDIDVAKYHVIGIDESQFFNDLKETVVYWVENLGKHVRVVGLDGDYQKNKFGQTLDIIPLADDVKKLSAQCKICLKELEDTNFCGNILSLVGPFTKRIGTSNTQIDVGGSNKYIPVCRYHHSTS